MTQVPTTHPNAPNSMVMKKAAGVGDFCVAILLVSTWESVQIGIPNGIRQWHVKNALIFERYLGVLL